MWQAGLWSLNHSNLDTILFKFSTSHYQTGSVSGDTWSGNTGFVRQRLKWAEMLSVPPCGLELVSEPGEKNAEMQSSFCSALIYFAGCSVARSAFRYSKQQHSIFWSFSCSEAHLLFLLTFPFVLFLCSLHPHCPANRCFFLFSLQEFFHWPNCAFPESLWLCSLLWSRL